MESQQSLWPKTNISQLHKVAQQFLPRPSERDLPKRIGIVKEVLKESLKAADESQIPVVNKTIENCFHYCANSGPLKSGNSKPIDQLTSCSNFQQIFQSFEKFLELQRQQFEAFLHQILSVSNNSLSHSLPSESMTREEFVRNSNFELAGRQMESTFSRNCSPKKLPSTSSFDSSSDETFKSLRRRKSRGSLNENNSIITSFDNQVEEIIPENSLSAKETVLPLTSHDKDNLLSNLTVLFGDERPKYLPKTCKPKDVPKKRGLSSSNRLEDVSNTKGFSIADRRKQTSSCSAGNSDLPLRTRSGRNIVKPRPYWTSKNNSAQQSDMSSRDEEELNSRCESNTISMRKNQKKKSLKAPHLQKEIDSENEEISTAVKKRKHRHNQSKTKKGRKK